MKNLFAKIAAIIDETNRMRKAEKFRREDRATVSNFFNGAPPLPQQVANELGFTVNVNHLFGYTELAEASDNVMALYNKPSNLVEVELDAAPPGKRLEWSQKATHHASRVLRKIRPFKTAYQGCAGDATMHGEAVFFYPDTTFPLPRQTPLSRLLIPDDSSTNTQELSHFGVESTLSVSDLTRYYKKKPQGWRAANVGKVLENIYKEVLTDGRQLDPENVEEMEYKRQENSATGERRRAKVDVVYFYQRNYDAPGTPFDLTVSLANHEDNSWSKDAPAKEAMVLFQDDCVVPRVEDCLHPFFMDCIIGGAPKWHRVLGLGPLNYQLNHAIELMICRAQQAVSESSMNLWQVANSSTRDAVQQILVKHNGILPEGVSLVNNRYEPNFAGMLQMIQFYRQQGGKNARGVTPNNGDQNDQLEVQAVAELNRGASASNNRTTGWYENADVLYTEAFNRLCNDEIDEAECGYSEVKDFQDAMQREGVPLWWLRRSNVRVRAVRLVGDGLRSKEMGVVSFLAQNRQQYAPEVQPKITRLMTALALDNYPLAEELTPIQEEQDSPQRFVAEQENVVMLTSRKPQPNRATDVDETHIVNHFPALESLIADALKFQKAAFIPPQVEAFQAIGAHIMAHIGRVEAKAVNVINDPEREKSAQFKKQLNDMAAMAEKLIKNMEASQQGEAQELTPAEQQKFELELEKLKLQREKMAFSVEKFNRQQSHREQGDAFKQVSELERDRRETQRLEHERQRSERDGARADVETANKIITTRQKASEPAKA